MTMLSMDLVHFDLYFVTGLEQVSKQPWQPQFAVPKNLLAKT